MDSFTDLAWKIEAEAQRKTWKASGQKVARAAHKLTWASVAVVDIVVHATDGMEYVVKGRALQAGTRDCRIAVRLR